MQPLVCYNFICIFFRIARAHLSDVGVYTCVASNRAGVDNKHYSLQVYGRSFCDIHILSHILSLFHKVKKVTLFG